jgi:hydroxymethylpyrimidine pyrophosphatase-like HAD family hydrolase
MLNNLEKLSLMAAEIGKLYDNERLSQLLAAKLKNEEAIVISDFDGTLFHKNDIGKTQRCIEAFLSYPKRIISSARSIDDLLDMLAAYNLQVDWIVGCSGSIVTNGYGYPLWMTPLEPSDVTRIEATVPGTKRIEINGQVLQIAAPTDKVPTTLGLRVEVYQGTAFIAHWEASKLRAIYRLLRHINWPGQVLVFGDGPYDSELIDYFDGTLITPSPTSDSRQRKEINHA